MAYRTHAFALLFAVVLGVGASAQSTPEPCDMNSISRAIEAKVMPSIIGCDTDAAVRIMARLKLDPVRNSVPSDVPAGQVIAQPYPAGTSFDRFRALSIGPLTYSAGTSPSPLGGEDAKPVREGEPLIFPVSRKGDAATALTVPYDVTQGSEWIGEQEPLVFAAGASQTELRLATRDTPDDDGARVIEVTFYDPFGDGQTLGKATGTITDNGAAAAYSLTVASPAIGESDEQTLTLVRTGRARELLGAALTFDCSIEAIEPADLSQIALDPRQSRWTFRVRNIDNGDDEPDRPCVAEIADPQGAILARAQFQLLDDDEPRPWGAAVVDWVVEDGGWTYVLGGIVVVLGAVGLRRLLRPGPVPLPGPDAPPAPNPPDAPVPPVFSTRAWIEDGEESASTVEGRHPIVQWSTHVVIEPGDVPEPPPVETIFEESSNGH